MLYTAQRVDISGFLRERLIPRFPCYRESFEWCVRQTPLGLPPEATDEGRPIAHWTHVKMGEIFEIPLVPYEIAEQDPLTLFMAGLSIAQRLLGDATAWVNFRMLKGSHVMIGKQFESLTEEGKAGYRAWVGFAARI